MYNKMTTHNWFFFLVDFFWVTMKTNGKNDWYFTGSSSSAQNRLYNRNDYSSPSIGVNTESRWILCISYFLPSRVMADPWYERCVPFFKFVFPYSVLRKSRKSCNIKKKTKHLTFFFCRHSVKHENVLFYTRMSIILFNLGGHIVIVTWK